MGHELVPITKPHLIQILREAVSQTHAIEPNALGLVLFGSRAVNAHEPNSDVDVYLVSQNYDYTAERLLGDSARERLYDYGLTLKIRSIPVDLERVQRAKTFEEERRGLATLFSVLDRHCVVITHDSQLDEEIREVLGLDEREWSRAVENSWKSEAQRQRYLNLSTTP